VEQRLQSLCRELDDPTAKDCTFTIVTTAWMAAFSPPALIKLLAEQEIPDQTRVQKMATALHLRCVWRFFQNSPLPSIASRAYQSSADWSH